MDESLFQELDDLDLDDDDDEDFDPNNCNSSEDSSWNYRIIVQNVAILVTFFLQATKLLYSIFLRIYVHPFIIVHGFV